MKKDKRGMSGLVVALLLIVVVAVVAVAALWESGAIVKWTDGNDNMPTGGGGGGGTTPPPEPVAYLRGSAYVNFDNRDYMAGKWALTLNHIDCAVDYAPGESTLQLFDFFNPHSATIIVKFVYTQLGTSNSLTHTVERYHQVASRTLDVVQVDDDRTVGVWAVGSYRLDVTLYNKADPSVAIQAMTSTVAVEAQ